MDPPWQNRTHEAIQDALKRLTGARWDADQKVWIVGPSALLLDFWTLAAEPNITITEAAWKLLRQTERRTKLSDAHEASNQDVQQRVDSVLPEGKRLYPFQYAAVEFIERAGGRALISDQMGMGKSIETIGFLALKPQLRPVVLVVPAVVAGNWMNELAAWLPDVPAQWLQKGATELDPKVSVWVVTYALLKQHLDAILAQNPQVVVGDEVHMIANKKTARGEAFAQLGSAPSIRSLIGLSGTPVINRPLEFFTFLSLLRPDEFGNWFRYSQRYCDGHYEEIFIPKGKGKKKKVWVAKGASNTEELHQHLRSLMIRRLKQDVLTELPAKQFQMIPVQLKPKERRDYNKVVKAAGDNALAAITAARQAVGAVKARAAIDWIAQHHTTETPLVVFAHHRDALDVLQAGAEKVGVRWGRIDGTTDAKKRTELVQQFQAGALGCMLLSTKAAGVGITLTRASDVLLVERQWTCAAEAQALDRLHRIGQQNTVMVRILVANGTVDDDMAELLQAKQNMQDAVLDGKQLGIPGQLDIRDELVRRWR